MTVVTGDPGSGAGQTSLQKAYENSGGVVPMIQLATADGTLNIRDDATPLAAMFAIQNNAGTSFFELDSTHMDYGLTGNRGYEFQLDPTGREGISFLPDGRTVTSTPLVTAAVQWSSTIISNIPGGAPFGNDTAPAMMAAIGECRFDDQPFLFATSLLFNQATILSSNGFNLGPVYTLVNQPTVRNVGGGNRTTSQSNAVRSQMRVGPNTSGNMTVVSHEAFFATVLVDATVGNASITTCSYFAPKAPTLTAGGTIGVLNVMDIPNIPVAGITTIRGINSAMSTGTFINHTGTANSRMGADNASMILGTGQDVDISWNGTGLDILFSQNNDAILINNPVNGQILFNTGVNEWNLATTRGFTLGDSSTLGNQFGNFVAPARTTQINGEWSDFLLTQAANLTVDDTMGLVAGWTINAPSMTLGTGTVTTAGGLNVAGNVNQGSVNRFGIRCLSNPSGGSGVNAALWITAGRSRFDGIVDINNPIALGGGAAATLGTIGGAGPTTAAQAQWVQIEINGTNHWIPVWT